MGGRAYNLSMSLFGLGLGHQRERRDENGTEHVVRVHPLRRVLAFTRRSIDDVINNPIARNEVYGYYKLYKQILRSSEVTELERQWNPLGDMGR